ncbi:hypothetical protein R69658_06866 [Paraburkholderia aspalathi]|uniref:Uncharacterized protein n=1 Tax=Paraburkholderia aspalathi TaxID=1324617 RepID=A0ABN7N7V4_9BURK|nr:hypothetical protein R69658_06866 [Paraburkholderia aspalathi]
MATAFPMVARRMIAAVRETMASDGVQVRALSQVQMQALKEMRTPALTEMWVPALDGVRV